MTVRAQLQNADRSLPSFEELCPSFGDALDAVFPDFPFLEAPVDAHPRREYAILLPEQDPEDTPVAVVDATVVPMDKLSETQVPSSDASSTHAGTSVSPGPIRTAGAMLAVAAMTTPVAGQNQQDPQLPAGFDWLTLYLCRHGRDLL